MKNILKGSIFIKENKKNDENVKFLSILFKVNQNEIPSEDEDKFINNKLSELNLLTIDTNYIIEFI